jgi:hypothetical protein
MNEDIEESFSDPEARSVLEDYHRRNMEEIRATVTRGAAGIEASYLFDQGILLGLGRD